MMDDVWFDSNNREAIYEKYATYRHFFDALSHTNRYENIGRGFLDVSFTSHELELVLMLRQMLTSGNTEREQMIEGFNHLADWFKRSDNSVTNCDYLFVQAYIAFIHERITFHFSEEDLDATTQENLLVLARFSIDMAESYAGQSLCYKHIRLESEALEEYVEERNQNLYELLCSLGSLSANTKDKLIDEIITTIKKEYLQQPPLDDDGFTNLYEYLGYIAYHGSDHALYQTAFEELDNTIHCKVSHLSLPDMVKLFEDEIDNIVDNGDMQDIDEWSDYSKVIVESSEFDRLLREIRGEFMRGVPEYFPE